MRTTLITEIEVEVVHNRYGFVLPDKDELYKYVVGRLQSQFESDVASGDIDVSEEEEEEDDYTEYVKRGHML